MTQILESLSLYNVTYAKSVNPPRTCKKGNRTPIDHIWISNFTPDAISKFGFLPFDYPFKSDHRGLFIDILLHHKPQRIPILPPKRALTSTNSKKRKNYFEYIDKKLQKFKFKEKLDNVFSCYSPNTSIFHQKINELDTLLTKWLLKAEKILLPHAWSQSSFSKAIALLR